MLSDIYIAISNSDKKVREHQMNLEAVISVEIWKKEKEQSEKKETETEVEIQI